MRPEYDGVKFYSKNDMSIGWELEKAEPILNSFDAAKEYNDVNSVLELYCVQQLIETGVALPSWTDDVHKRYCSLVKEFNPILGRFFGKIDDLSFMEIQSNVCISYLDDFWKLFVKFKVYNKISSETMQGFLKQPDTTLYKLLERRELVEHYDSEFAEVLRSSDQTARILVSKFLEKGNTVCYLPKSFGPSEYEEVLLRYVHGEYANSNVLQLIYNAQSTAKCPISDKLRLEAKRAFEKFWSEHADGALNYAYGIDVTFQIQDELKKYENQGTNYRISYDVRWLEESLDYPSILNNFRYVFEMFDNLGRSTLVSVKSQISAVEGLFAVDGIKFYKRGNHFNAIDMLSSAQTSLYHNFLMEHGIDLEAVFKWFFEQYLPSEFGVEGFGMNASSLTATYIEKCRNLAAEMDGVLKQFRMFVRDGSIDRELFEMSSEHMILEGIPSLIDGKYAYASSKEVNNEMFALFSDQSVLSFTERTKSKYSTLFELLRNESVRENDFKEWQLNSLKWLAQRGSILIEDSGAIKLASARVLILKDLYEHDVLCVQAFNKWKTVIDLMIQNGDLTVESTLFSLPETEYLNYELNKSQFSDGLDLRNKYTHSTYSNNEKEQHHDYVQLLKLMVLVITKMNDEFCFWADSKEVTT